MKILPLRCTFYVPFLSKLISLSSLTLLPFLDNISAPVVLQFFPADACFSASLTLPAGFPRCWFGGFLDNQKVVKARASAQKVPIRIAIQEDHVKKHSIWLFAIAVFVAAGSAFVTSLTAQEVRQLHNHIRLVDPNQLTHPLTTPAGENPATFACIYGLVSTIVPGCPIDGTTAVPTGGSEGIVIVDAYDYPTAASDLATFSAQFGLPTAKFDKVYATGKKPASGCTGIAGLENWGLEESLDIEYAHAMAPNAIIVLMEAASASDADLYSAVQKANQLIASHHAKAEVSMSWGGSESSSELSDDTFFTQSGVTYFASSGDTPGTEYPSTSPNVVSVGGTVVNRNSSGDYTSQSAWSDGGGGLSPYEPIPSFQSVISGLVGTNRGVPDVSLIAGTATAIYNAGGSFCGSGWEEVEGTSIAAPSMAGIINSAGTFNSSSNAQNTEMYGELGDSSVFTDITSGSCGTHSATTGWDFCTGLGVPNGYLGK
jgi:kumamolisin